ncbi:hypothetical protein N9F48_01130 [Akkermansiaceae bacterium]|nr:hypothetical protein [Akkermansiaceae bacterium]MDA7629942.1 hypothetical protein [Akkermansiaceae bacterium]MDA8968646.1 hypothetical protein [Akkermansiaceae bacterium]MDB0068224.1 hypothetical protein [Akkermansiaceae bacterium]MDB4273478.1 hypothetical protein [Akkermansiaceae bacterium]
MTYFLRRFAIASLGLAALTFSSCGVARSLIQIPGRTLQSMGRTVGLGIEMTETVPEEMDVKKRR